MLTIGDKFPAFKLKAVVSLEKGKEFEDISNEDHPGKWKVVFFWPKDFTFVCPTEIAAFGKQNRDFDDRDAQVLGVSTDNEYVHLAWRKNHPDLKNLPFPMLADIKRELSSALGIMHPKDGRGRCARPSSSIRTASSASSRSTTWTSAATSTRCCACWTPCRPTSSARATGKRANRRCGGRTAPRTCMAATARRPVMPLD